MKRKHIKIKIKKNEKWEKLSREERLDEIEGAFLELLYMTKDELSGRVSTILKNKDEYKELTCEELKRLSDKTKDYIDRLSTLVTDTISDVKNHNESDDADGDSDADTTNSDSANDIDNSKSE